jgi:hypothetical protein
MRQLWHDWERQSRKQAVEAGVTVIKDIDRSRFETVTAPLRDALRADPQLGPMIRRIEAEK